jgi:hypothetical protein
MTQPPTVYETVANGTIVGSGVSASYCGAFAYLYASPYTTPPNDILLFLNSIDGNVQVDSPNDAIEPLLSGMMQVGAAAPSVYTSEASCGFLSFTYWLPAPANVDCGDASGPSCPTGCSSVCSSQGCLPCEPILPEVDYGAWGVSDCLQSGQLATTGSWTITLTSVTPYAGPANNNGPHYVVHGTIAATLPGGDNKSVNVTAAF